MKPIAIVLSLLMITTLAPAFAATTASARVYCVDDVANAATGAANNALQKVQSILADQQLPRTLASNSNNAGAVSDCEAFAHGLAVPPVAVGFTYESFNAPECPLSCTAGVTVGGYQTNATSAALVSYGPTDVPPGKGCSPSGTCYVAIKGSAAVTGFEGPVHLKCDPGTDSYSAGAWVTCGRSGETVGGATIPRQTIKKFYNIPFGTCQYKRIEQAATLTGLSSGFNKTLTNYTIVHVCHNSDLS